MTTQNEEYNDFQTQCFEPFPEPQTIPSGWDLSEIVSAKSTPDVDAAVSSSGEEN